MTLATRASKKTKSPSEPQVRVNFGYVKKQVQPGSWRRGYGYYKENKIEAITMMANGVEAKVKGKYKDYYTTRIYFKPEGLKPECNCPLEEKWCKHAVAVALESVEQKFWEEYWELPSHDDELFEPVVDPQGRFRFVFNSKLNPKNFGLKIINRRTKKPVTKLEPVLMQAIEEQNQSEEGMNEATRREFAVLQKMLKEGFPKTNRPDSYFSLPFDFLNTILPMLSEVEEVTTPKNVRLLFQNNPLELVMSVNVSMAGNVLVSFHWHRKDPEDAFPMEEVELFAKDVPWCFYDNRIYPLSTALNALPKYLTRSSFTDIRDADGGKFMYEELPKLRKHVIVEAAEVLKRLNLETRAPKKKVKLEIVDEVALRLRISLNFSYDGVEVPYSKGAPDTPYVMVVKKDKELIYWMKRETELEQEAYDKLLGFGMDPMQTNYFQADGDSAIDFYNACRRKDLGPDWDCKMDDEKLKPLLASDNPLKILATIEFSQSVDAFLLTNSCLVGDKQMNLDDVQGHLVQGKKYFFLKGQGYVEIPLAHILQYQRILQAFDAQQISDDTYQISTFKVGLIAELMDNEIELKMSKKFKKFWNVVSASTEMEDVEKPDNVNAELRTYQLRGYNWLWFLYSYGLNGILADDMGLGKTVQALTVLQKAKSEDGPKPSLVVCPTSIVFNWENEIARFTPDLKCVNLTGPNRHDVYKQIKDADVVVTSYAILRRDVRALKGYPFRYVILDESQYIKNPDAQTTRSAKQLQCQHRLALSGTPIENRLSELWSVFDFLMPTFLYDMEDFKYKYILPIEERGNREAERRLKKQVFPFILRRMKQDVMSDLPPKIENVQFCSMTDEQRDLYLNILEEVRDEIFSNVADKGIDAAKGSIFTLLLRLRQICCHPKLLGPERNRGIEESGKFEALKDMLGDIIENGHRVLLFSQFVEMLDIIKRWLEVEGISYEYLTGQTKHRQQAVERFNDNPNIPIFLISLKAGGTGLNLTGADYVIHYDPWWNPMAEDQATDRAHRIGQTKTVFVYRLITKGTVEEKILRLQGRKRSLVDSIIRADRSMGKFLSFEDLKEILSPDL